MKPAQGRGNRTEEVESDSKLYCCDCEMGTARASTLIISEQICRQTIDLMSRSALLLSKILIAWTAGNPSHVFMTSH